MYHSVLKDARGFELLWRLDGETAAAARARGCFCGGRLHAAPYQRKPRGGPDLPKAMEKRFSFSCDREGCRRRVTPPSLRFLDRKVYFAAVILLVPVLTRDVRGERLRKLLEVLKIQRQTLERWVRWWRESFPVSCRWQSVRGLFASPPASAAFPQSLLDAFPPADDVIETILPILRIVTGVPLR